MDEELVGRGSVLEQMSALVTTPDDRGGALLLVGDRGIGKTACLAWARAVAETHGHLVLETAGSDPEKHLSFAGLHRLLRPVLDSADALPAVQRGALLAALGMRDAATGDDLMVFVATVNLLRHVSRRRRVVVVVDDVQWLDPETQRVVAFVARRVEDLPVTLLAATSPLPTASLVDAFGELHLGRLGEEDANHLVERHGPHLDAAHREWVAGLAAGNPLALLELARTSAGVDLAEVDPVWSLTPRLERAFAGAARELCGDAGDAALVAAVATDPRLPEVLAATSLLCGRPVGLAVLEEARFLGRLHLDEERVSFVHPLVKAAILLKEPASRRQAAHRALGEVITLSGERRAWHRAHGTTRHDDVIAAELEATVPESLRRGDAGTALGALERSAQLSTVSLERGRRLLTAARLAARLGRPGAVRRLLTASVDAGLSDFDRIRAVLLQEDFDGAVIAEGGRVRQLCAGARRAAAAGEVSLAWELTEAAARRRCAAPVGSSALAELSALARGLAAGSSDGRALAVLALADPVAHGRAVLAGLTAAGEAVERDADELTAYGVAARAVGDYRAALTFFDLAQTGLRAGGLLGPLGRNLSVVADICLDLGEWDRAAAALTDFEVLSASCMSASHRASALATAAKLAAARGEVDRAFDLVAELEHSAAAHTGSRFLARAKTARGMACIAAGDHPGAFDVLSRVVDPGAPSHHFREQFDAVPYFAEAAAHTGRSDDVRHEIERLGRIAQESGSPILTTHLQYAEAVLAPDHLAEASFLAALAAGCGDSPWYRARTQLAYGRWLRRRHRVIESRGPLRAASTVLRRLGAGRWAAEANDELDASGVGGATGPSTQAADCLSPQELRITQLAAQGLSNKEIGARMYLSPRTVSSHLYRIFPKLGISSRSQLAAHLEGQVNCG